MKILLRDFMQKWRDRIFSNRKLGMRVYIKKTTLLSGSGAHQSSNPKSNGGSIHGDRTVRAQN